MIAGTRRSGLVLACLAVGPAAILLGAPMLPPPHRLSDETIALAHIHKVRLELGPIAGPLAGAGLTAQAIEDAWTRALTDAGFELAPGDPAATELRLVTLGATDPAVPGGVAYTLNLQVLQQVRLERFEQPLKLPTHGILVSGLEKESEVAGAVRRMAQRLITRFVQLSRNATAEIATSPAAPAAGGQ